MLACLFAVLDVHDDYARRSVSVGKPASSLNRTVI